MILAIILIFILGTIFGSFMNVVAIRHNTGRSFAHGRSACMHCNSKLGFWELIPIVSFLTQKGRCKNCNAKISLQYIASEIITGLLFVGVSVRIYEFFVSYGNIVTKIPEFLVANIIMWGFVCFLVAIIIYDTRHLFLPDAFLIPAIVISFFLPSIITSLATGDFVFKFQLLSGLWSALPFLILYVTGSGKWMGFGDVKLGLMLGFLLGTQNGLVAVLLSFWVGAVIGLVYMYVNRKHKTSHVLPFAPAIIIATMLVFIFGIGWPELIGFIS